MLEEKIALAKRLFDYMRKEELSMTGLSRKLSVCPQTIRRLFNDNLKTILRYSTISRICNFLDNYDAENNKDDR